jgi:hypothetical protein
VESLKLSGDPQKQADNGGLSLKFFNDRDSLSELKDDDLVKKLEGEELVTAKDPGAKDNHVDFCGLVSINRVVSVFLPRSINAAEMTDSEQILLASNLMRALVTYSRDGTKKTPIHLGGPSEEIKGGAELDFIITLIERYRENGLYSRRRSTKSINSGKPDWKATISSSTAFPNSAGQPIYLDIISSKRRYFSDCEVARIQAEILRRIDENFSWIVTLKPGKFAPELEDMPYPRGGVSNDYMLAMLRRELPLLYSDSDIRLVKSLINYLETGDDKNASSESGTLIGATQFHWVWEKMLDSVLNSVWSEVQNHLPKPEYKKADGAFIRQGKGMQTDTVLRRDKYVVVVDAKYYKTAAVTDMPGWKDIVKQLFYEKGLKAYDNTLKIRNTFVFPGVGGELKAAHLRSEDGKKSFDEDFPPIFCHYADPQEVIECYVSGRKMDKFSEELFQPFLEPPLREAVTTAYPQLYFF